MTESTGRAVGSGNPFGAWTTVDLPGGSARVADLGILAEATGHELARLPYSIRVLLESALRHCGRGVVREDDVLAVLGWNCHRGRRARVRLHARPGVAAGLHRRAVRGRSGRSALGHRPEWGRPESHQSQRARSTWSSITRFRWTTPACQMPACATWSSRWSATASATRCCVGLRGSSTTCASCRRGRASATR